MLNQLASYTLVSVKFSSSVEKFFEILKKTKNSPPFVVFTATPSHLYSYLLEDVHRKCKDVPDVLDLVVKPHLSI